MSLALQRAVANIPRCKTGFRWLRHTASLTVTCATRELGIWQIRREARVARLAVQARRVAFGDRKPVVRLEFSGQAALRFNAPLPR